ncbi:MAG TPA: SH3 domain-containing protein [Rhizomicrobium sp.]|jgi:SH3-like domain-containing protein|nr:SH3 domain-containing protein [Rhizomicrobium sp.]
MTRIATLLTIAALTFAALQTDQAIAQPAPATKVLRYVSQRADTAYMREGPTYAHRVLWVYRHKGYPFAVLAQFDVWRRVQAADGTIGWMSATMLSDQRTVLVTGKGRAQIHAEPQGGKVVALADPGAIAGLRACAPKACRIRGENVDGWIPKSRIWGVGADEVFDKLR